MKKLLLLILSILLAGCTQKVVSTKPSFSIETKDSINLKDEYTYLNQYLDSFMNDQDYLPATILDEQEVVWSVASGKATISDNTIIKDEDALEYEPIVLQATVEDNTYTFDNILLLDKYVGYVMAYFGGEEEDYENVKLAFTYDCMSWYKLNDDKYVLEATIGTKKVRDPYIMRKKDGSFVLMATQGWDNPEIYMWDSNDLTSFENERLVKVNDSKDNSLSEKQAWAPEGFYDRRYDEYIIYWSSVDDGKMFYNISKDMNAFSYPEVFVDRGFPIIDGTVYKYHENYYLIAKDEQEPMEEHSQLFIGTTDTDYYGFNKFSEPFTNHQSEGPFILEDGGQFFLYYDDYTRKQFHVMSGWWISPEDLELQSDYDMVFTIEEPRHASVVPVTWKELNRVIDKYGAK